MKKLLFFVLLLVVAMRHSYAQDTTRLSLLFVGDVMGHDSQIAAAYDPVTKKYDYTSCFRFIKPYLQSADLTIGNLEVTLAGPPHKGYPQFSSPDALLTTLKDAGFDVLVTANNHCVDRGKKGLERTIMMLDSFHIAHTGTFVDTVSRLNDHPLLVEKNGFTLAILNYTYGTNGLPVYKPNIVNRLDTATMRKDLRRARELKPDAIIVFTHWGQEYQSLPSAEQKRLTEFCFNHGAQLVIGAHPHVIQPMEFRKDKNQFVAYSLGNFVSGQRKRYTDGGAMAYLELEKIKNIDGTSATRIDSAGYYTQWVNKNAKKKYELLVVGDETAVSSAALSKEANLAYETFIRDTRQLFTKHNKAVKEIDVEVGLDRIDRINSACAYREIAPAERKKNYPFDTYYRVALASFGTLSSGDAASRIPLAQGKVDLKALTEIKYLEPAAVDSLTSILYNYAYKGQTLYANDSKCFLPHHAILFVNDAGEVAGYVEICFQCDNWKTSSDKISMGDACTDKLLHLKKFFTDTGIKASSN